MLAAQAVVGSLVIITGDHLGSFIRLPHERSVHPR